MAKIRGDIRIPSFIQRLIRRINVSSSATLRDLDRFKKNGVTPGQSIFSAFEFSESDSIGRSRRVFDQFF